MGLEQNANVVESETKIDKDELEPEINDQILSAFMELDPVFNPSDVDNNVETWDPNFTVDCFDSVTNPHANYKIDKVRVDFMWLDKTTKKLYYFLHDKHGSKMAAEVPPNLVTSYKEKDFAQTFVSIHNFQVGYVDPTQYLRYQNYGFVRRDWLIQINSNTFMLNNPFTEETNFQMHTWLPSIRDLVADKTPRKMLINTVGRVVRGGQKQPAGQQTCEIWLRDLTGAEIKFVSVHKLRKLALKLAKAILEQGTLYITRVKLVHAKPVNLLVDTELTGIEFDPPFHKTEVLQKMRI